jgi:regulator of replication initiation timing
MGGMFSKPDTSAQERAIAETMKENKRLRLQAEEERRELAEQATAKRRSRLAGGSRMLLSSARLNAEQGIQTLGASDTEVA